MSTLTAAMDISTPAGVVKMLIQNTNKLSSKALKEAMSRGSGVALQGKQTKEALFVKRFQQNVKEEQANYLRWQVHLGRDPVSGQSRRQRLEEREVALREYTVRWRDVRQEEEFRAPQTKRSSARVQADAGQAPEGASSFQLSSGPQRELRQRALGLFQKAARKVGIQCRVNRRLACFRKLADGTRHLPAARKAEEETSDVKISPDKVFPFSFPIYSDDGDPLAHSNLVTVPVAAIDVAVTTCIPFFELQVPQHFELMGYRPVSTWEAFNSSTPYPLARPLRTAPLATVSQPEDVEANEAASLRFTAPEELLRPPPANPLRIFNPAPGLQAYKATPKYLESDLEFHLCPVPRLASTTPHALHTQELMDRQEVIKGIMTWKYFDPMTLSNLSERPAPTSSRRFIDYSTDILPLSAPPPLTALPDDLTPLMDKPCEYSGVQLTPAMIRAQFSPREALVSHGNLVAGATTRYSESTGTTST